MEGLCSFMIKNESINKKYGIEAVSIYVPRHFLSLDDLARVKNIDGSKYTIGLGLDKMSILDPTEDPVTLGANACKELIDRSQVDINDIGLLIVGTESGIDESKPISIYLHKMLGLPSSCRCMDVKNACYAGTAALKTALSWLFTPSSKNKKAIVITTDVAYYEFGSLAEPTQGAGAVGLLVSDSPDIIEIDVENEAIFTKEVMDFWRPTYRNTAIVNGHYSMECYLEGLINSYNCYKGMTKLQFVDYDHFVFHTPFPKMAYKALKTLYDFEQNIQPARETMDELFKKKVFPSLKASREMGNVYTSSLFSSFISLIEDGEIKKGQRVGFYSYGSGSSSEFFSGIVGKSINEWKNNTGLNKRISRRRQISYDEYLLYRAAYEQRMKNGYFVKDEPTSNSPFIYLGIKNHQRQYSWITPNLEINSENINIKNHR
jgi:hydroxymethylglutaryl-CoA synthase